MLASFRKLNLVGLQNVSDTSAKLQIVDPLTSNLPVQGLEFGKSAVAVVAAENSNRGTNRGQYYQYAYGYSYGSDADKRYNEYYSQDNDRPIPKKKRDAPVEAVSGS